MADKEFPHNDCLKALALIRMDYNPEDALYSQGSKYRVKNKEKIFCLELWIKALVLHDASREHSSHNDVIYPIFKEAYDKSLGCGDFVKTFRESLREHAKKNGELLVRSKNVIREEFKRANLYNNHKLYSLYIMKKMNYFGREKDGFITDLTIEHIMPQHNNISNQRLHSVGNLTLLSQSYNSQIKDKDFNEKREILKKTQCALNRYFEDECITKWDDEEIDKRSEILTELFLDIFWDEIFDEE